MPVSAPLGRRIEIIRGDGRGENVGSEFTTRCTLRHHHRIRRDEHPSAKCRIRTRRTHFGDSHALPHERRSLTTYPVGRTNADGGVPLQPVAPFSTWKSNSVLQNIRQRSGTVKPSSPRSQTLRAPRGIHYKVERPRDRRQILRLQSRQ
ncbi:unnamed protein product [Ectocarpus sp. 12 AP-2014]